MGVSLDLKPWFRYLVLSPKAKRWARFRLSSAQTEGQCFQMEDLPFGLKSSPVWAHRLSKTVITWARQQGFRLAWYVDDVLILGTSRETLLEQLTMFI